MKTKERQRAKKRVKNRSNIVAQIGPNIIPKIISKLGQHRDNIRPTMSHRRFRRLPFQENHFWKAARKATVPGKPFSEVGPLKPGLGLKPCTRPQPGPGPEKELGMQIATRGVSGTL